MSLGPLNTLTSYLPGGLSEKAAQFRKNVMEGAVLSTAATALPHIFKYYGYIDKEFPILMNVPTSIAAAVASTVAYASYMTLFKPISDKTSETFSEIPKKVSDFTASVVAVEDTDKVKREFLYSTPVWGLGMLSLSGYLHSHISGIPFEAPFNHPAVPVIASVAGALGLGWLVHEVIVSGTRQAREWAKESDAFAKTCEAVDAAWNLVGSTVKATAIGLGIAVAAKTNKEILEPIANSTVGQGAATAAETLWSWAAAPITLASPYVKDAATASKDFVSGVIFRAETLKKCAENSDNIALCLTAKGVDHTFTYVLNPIGTAISATASGIGTVAGGITSGTKSAFGVATAGLGILSGLIYRKETLAQCANAASEFATKTEFATNNPFLCNNAQRIETLVTETINPAGSWVYDSLGSVGQGAWNLGAQAVDLSKPVFKQAVTLGGAGLDTAVSIATNPTVQYGALVTVAAGVSLFALHFIATKAMCYYNQKANPVPVQDDLLDLMERGELGQSPALPPVNAEPSAPPMSPEMMKQLYGTEPLPVATAIPVDSPVIGEPIIEPSAPLLPPPPLPAQINGGGPAVPPAVPGAPNVVPAAPPAPTLWATFQNKVSGFVAGVKEVGVWMKNAVVCLVRRFFDFFAEVGERS